MSCKIICALSLLAVIAFKDANGLECKLCIGSPTSDCAHDVDTAMVTQECRNIPVRPIHNRRWHHRHHHRHHFETTTPINEEADDTNDDNVSDDDSTAHPENDERNNLDDDNESTTDSNNVDDGTDGRKYLKTHCVYLRIKESNDTTAIVSRGCGYSPEKQDLCKIIKKWNKNMTACKLCDSDNCN